MTKSSTIQADDRTWLDERPQARVAESELEAQDRQERFGTALALFFTSAISGLLPDPIVHELTRDVEMLLAMHPWFAPLVAVASNGPEPPATRVFESSEESSWRKPLHHAAMIIGGSDSLHMLLMAGKPKTDGEPLETLTKLTMACVAAFFTGALGATTRLVARDLDLALRDAGPALHLFERLVARCDAVTANDVRRISFRLHEYPTDPRSDLVDAEIARRHCAAMFALGAQLEQEVRAKENLSAN